MEKLTMRRFYAEVFKSEKSIYEAKQVSEKRKKVLIKRNFLVAGFRIAGYHKREDIFACVKKNV